MNTSALRRFTHCSTFSLNRHPYRSKGRRKDGRWKRGSVIQKSVLRDDGRHWIEAMRLAGIVIDYAPHLADQVIGADSASQCLAKWSSGPCEHPCWQCRHARSDEP